MSLGIYIHAPWCTLRCPYCSFTVYVDRNPPFEQWMERILRNWQWHSKQFNIDQNEISSIYFGGGTPSLVPIPLLEKIISVLPKTTNTEITIEMNPEDVTEEILQYYYRIGINRLSIGIQSFHPKHAKILRRSHTVKQAHHILQVIKEGPIKNWSFDLIFGLPKQSLEDLYYDLDYIQKLQPPHISLYGLSYEEGTPITRAVEQQKIVPIEDDIWKQQFDNIVKTLTDLGYRRYEVSNFSKLGFESRHNENTWKGLSYIGLGPSAHGYLPNKNRTLYDSNFQKWLQQEVPYIEESSQEQLMMDLILTRLRHVDGIPLNELYLLGYVVDISALQNYIEQGLLEYHSSNQLKLGPHGWNVVDSLILKVIEVTDRNI